MFFSRINRSSILPAVLVVDNSLGNSVMAVVAVLAFVAPAAIALVVDILSVGSEMVAVVAQPVDNRLFVDSLLYKEMFIYS